MRISAGRSEEEGLKVYKWRLINIVFPMKMFYFIISKKERIKWEIWKTTFLCIHDTIAKRDFLYFLVTSYISEPEKVFIFPEGVFIAFSRCKRNRKINRIKNISIFNVFNSSYCSNVPNIIIIYVSKLQ